MALKRHARGAARPQLPPAFHSHGHLRRERTNARGRDGRAELAILPGLEPEFVLSVLADRVVRAGKLDAADVELAVGQVLDDHEEGLLGLAVGPLPAPFDDDAYRGEQAVPGTAQPRRERRAEPRAHAGGDVTCGARAQSAGERLEDLYSAVFIRFGAVDGDGHPLQGLLEVEVGGARVAREHEPAPPEVPPPQRLA